VAQQDAISWPDVMSLGLALLAFLVAVLSLYLGNIKRAEIVVTFLPDEPPTVSSQVWTDLGDEGRFPQEAVLAMPLVVYNVGARAGAITRIRLERLDEIPAGDPLFIEFGTVPRDLAGKEVYESGALRVLTPNVSMRFSFPISNPTDDLVTLRRRLSDREGLKVGLSYRYIKGRSLIPWRRHHPTVIDEGLEFDVSLRPYLDSTYQRR
jgi:hypothetical protein